MMDGAPLEVKLHQTLHPIYELLKREIQPKGSGWRLLTIERLGTEPYHIDVFYYFKDYYMNYMEMGD